MALDIVGPLGRSGRVIVSDERDDGTIILLVCTTYNDQIGAVYLHPEPVPDEPPGGFPWPSRAAELREDLALPESVRPPFDLTVDTSNLPAGPQAFRNADFLRSAFEAGGKYPKVSLDEHTAEEWGWVGIGEPNLA